MVKLVTPPLSDTILDGVTRDSLLTIARDAGIVTEERSISINEITAAITEEKPVEVFGAGTAAVVAPVSAIGVDDVLYKLPAYDTESTMFQLKKKLEAIRTGYDADRYGWNFIVA